MKYIITLVSFLSICALGAVAYASGPEYFRIIRVNPVIVNQPLQVIPSFQPIDSDSDGLSDMCEAKLGTDPYNPDTDMDGLKDSDEDANHNCVFESDMGETNPLSPDTDGDGIMDGNEIPGCALNSDPNCGSTDSDIDSDGDGLTDECEANLGTNPNDWDTDSDGVSDGVEDANHNCVFEPNLDESSPLVADTDADGLIDGIELKLGTSPIVNDTDGDGIMDGDEDANHNGVFEFNLGETNPLSYDTDEDGLGDGMEQNIGSDPLNPDTDNDGIVDGKENPDCVLDQDPGC